MRLFSYDFDLPEENKLVRDLPFPNYSRGFEKTLNAFIDVVEKSAIKDNPRFPVILGRFLAVRSPLFAFFLLTKIQEGPLRSLIIDAFRERPIHLESLKEHCNKVLKFTTDGKTPELTPAIKRNITVLVNDLYQLSDTDIEDVGYQCHSAVLQQLKDKTALAYEKAFSKCLTGLGDQRDLAMLTYSFVAGASTESELSGRLLIIRNKAFGWGDYRRKVYNCLSIFKDFIKGYDTAAINVNRRVLGDLLEMFEPAAQSKPLPLYGRNRFKAPENKPRPYDPIPKIDGFRQCPIADLLNLNNEEPEREAVFVKINYNRISGELIETKAFCAARAAIDFILEFKNEAVRNVQTLASFVSYFEPRTEAALVNEAITTFKANTELLTGQELNWAYIAMLPWMPSAIDNQTNDPTIAMYNDFRNEARNYVANFHRHQS